MSALGNSVYKRKMITEARWKGLGGLAATWGIYSAYNSVAMITGAWLPMGALALTATWTLKQFGINNGINQIDLVEGGKIRIEVANSAFGSKVIIADPAKVRPIAQFEKTTAGYSEKNNTFLFIENYTDENGNEHNEAICFPVGGDAYKDQFFFDWLVSHQKEGSKTDADFTDLMVYHNKQLQNKKLDSGAVLMKSVNKDINVNMPQLKEDEISEDGLRKLVDTYGAEKVSKMNEQEAYLAYKSVC